MHSCLDIRIYYSSPSSSYPSHRESTSPHHRRPHHAQTHNGSTDEQQLSTLLADLASKPSAEILDALRGLERKTSTVFTLLKASVYSIVLQQEIREEGVADGGSYEEGYA